MGYDSLADALEECDEKKAILGICRMALNRLKEMHINPCTRKMPIIVILIAAKLPE